MRWLALAGGLAAILAVLVGPGHELAARSLAGHMVQHMVLLLVAPPLLLLARPLPRLAAMLPPRARTRVARALGGRALRRLLDPAVAALLQALVVTAWHVPALFQAALRAPALHALEHASLLGVGLLFWHGLVEPRRAGGAALLGALVATIACGFLGAVLTFAPRPLYGTSLADQQLAGLLMWVPGGFVYLGAALAALHAWLFRGRAA